MELAQLTPLTSHLPADELTLDSPDPSALRALGHRMIDDLFERDLGALFAGRSVDLNHSAGGHLHLMAVGLNNRVHVFFLGSGGLAAP